jgi:hypothetical protein
VSDGGGSEIGDEACEGVERRFHLAGGLPKVEKVMVVCGGRCVILAIDKGKMKRGERVFT